MFVGWKWRPYIVWSHSRIYWPISNIGQFICFKWGPTCSGVLNNDVVFDLFTYCQIFIYYSFVFVKRVFGDWLYHRQCCKIWVNAGCSCSRAKNVAHNLFFAFIPTTLYVCWKLIWFYAGEVERISYLFTKFIDGVPQAEGKRIAYAF